MSKARLIKKAKARQIDNLCRDYADFIYVREYLNGGWGTYNLTSLPPALRERHIRRFRHKSFWPHLVLPPETGTARAAR